MKSVIDIYRIFDPYGRDLAPEAHWLRGQPKDAEVWLTWKLVGGEELAYDKPLTAFDRESVALLLERAHLHGPDVGVQLNQGYDRGEAPPRFVDLGQVAEMYVVVRA